MFESLSNRLGGVFDRMRGRGALREEDVAEAMREIRVALLEADVALPVVKDFIEKVKAEATGQNVIKSIRPDQQVVKIVHDAMVEMLGGGEAAELRFASPPCAYLMVGLQGSGKTTSAAKIARLITDKQRKKVLMASLDIHRPAAQEQLRQLGVQTGIATLDIIPGQQPLEIARRAMDTARKEGYDVVMLDTAGRLAIDEALMNEVAEVARATNPIETLLVADAMTGQDAVNVAKAFNDKIGITGVMLTRVDGDARGGAAMSMKSVTGKPVKLIGLGEKWDAIEYFHPDRMAGRILGMGDVVSLVEKAVETIDRNEAEKVAKKFAKGEFDFTDLLSQMRQMQKMGGMGAMMKMLPGLGKLASQIDQSKLDEGVIKRQEAIILSMTLEERLKPQVLNAKRKIRIATGSGTTVQDVNRLYKQLQDMQTMMKRMKKMGMGKMMGQMKDMMGETDANLLAQSMDPNMLGEDMAKLVDEAGSDPSALGDNPFLPGGALSRMGNPFGNPAGGLNSNLLAGLMGKNKKK
jgi:signal recognition particle subunit SRP54